MKIQFGFCPLFKGNLNSISGTDRLHNGINILARQRGPAFAQQSLPLFVLGWMTHKRTEQSHDLDVVLFRMLRSEALERVDAAKTDCEDIAAEHLGPLLVTLVQQAAFRRGSLL